MRIEKFFKTITSVMFLNVWFILVIGFYGIQGYINFSKVESIIPLVTISITLTFIYWIIMSMIKRAKSEDFSILQYLKQVPMIFLIYFTFIGYVVNYKYSGQNIYVYTSIFASVMFMSVILRISRKIYDRKLRKIRETVQ